MIDLSDLEGFDNLEDIQKELQRRMKTHNESAIDDFEGLTPTEMQALHYKFPDSDEPLQFNTLSEKQLEQCPLLLQARLLIGKMKDKNTIELTKTGALRPKLVKEVYGLGLLKNDMIELGFMKLSKEMDAPTVEITRVLLEISSLVKKRHGRLSLTLKGEKLADDGNAILKELITVLLHKFNWGYFDGYDYSNIGKINPAYSLYLLKKYGDKKRIIDFYGDLYFKAFPQLRTEDTNLNSIYALRTFERYFKYFGLVKVENKKYPEPYLIQRTRFFESLIS